MKMQRFQRSRGKKRVKQKPTKNTALGNFTFICFWYMNNVTKMVLQTDYSNEKLKMDENGEILEPGTPRRS